MRIEANAVGLSFRKDDIFNTLKPTGQVELVRNPYICKENADKNDELACEIWYTDKKDNRVMLGFLKKGSYAQSFAAENTEIMYASIKGYCYAVDPNATNPQFNNDHNGRLASITIILTDGDDDVTFNEDGEYIINGKSYMRLSNVLSHFDCEPKNEGLKRWMIDTFKTFWDYFNKLNQLAADGTKLHKAIEIYIKSGFKTSSDLIPLDANGNNCLDEFIKKYDVVFLETEKTVFSDRFGIAGTMDAVCTLVPKKGAKRIKVVLDWKSAKAVRKKMKLQIGWYAAMEGAEEGWVITFGGTQKCGYGRSVNKKVIECFRCVCMIKRTIEAYKLTA